MLVLIDNFDSFTYNLVQYFGEIGAEVLVFRNDAIDCNGIRELQPRGIVISPGPGRPEDAGITLDAIHEFAGKIPILGVCLGHQALGMAFGGKVVRAPELMHGKTSAIHHDGRNLFRGAANPLLATRYHSLIVEEGSLPACLEITARTETGLIMGLRHRELLAEGVQFHPESIMTTSGKILLKNFLHLCGDLVSSFAPASQLRTAAASATPHVEASPSNPGQAHPREQDLRGRGSASLQDLPVQAEARPENTKQELTPVAGRSMIQQAIRQVVERADLTRSEAYAVMQEIMNGEATPAQIGAFLAALRMKGERVSEITGFAQAMRERATVVSTRHQNAIDICGTGGDGKGTFNISTVAAFVVAGAGVPVAKHGSYSVSSGCGSADVLKELGLNIDLDAEQMGRCLDELGIAFLFAPRLHPAMKHAVAPRREIGMRTIFNILGPITNPAGVRRQMIGVFDRRLTTMLAEVLAELGTEQALLVHSDEGLDEVSIHGRTLTVELMKGRISERALTPEDFGLQRCTDGIYGGAPVQNAQIALRILQGERGAPRDIVVANAACGLLVAGAVNHLKEGVKLAEYSLASGAALSKLEALRKMSHASTVPARGAGRD
ncbi:MAG: anthranilate phosphoribosyltransferase [bacterium]